ncbi:ribosomal RNA small subunit methyltransferase A [Candidatus Saccharibacteria bacterium]|nr:ribosomal RNA small subunit methyltransferase A [Candidatus Saccharibacteria bacterium]
MKNKKSLGQHWLKDRAILDQIADLAFVDGVNTCLEIGPGLGTLTSALLRRYQKVIAVEYDKDLATKLPGSFPGKDLTVINQDFLQFDFSSLPADYVVAGNIPYYITSPIIAKLLFAQPAPKRIVLLIQKEVAERILAGASQQTLLSLTVQNYADVFPGFVVHKNYFTPPPKVDSAVIILEPRRSPIVPESALELAKLGFSNPRKKLAKNLPYPKSDILNAFSKLGISENARPANLTLNDWKDLANLLEKR